MGNARAGDGVVRLASVGECMVELRDWPAGGAGAMRRSFGGDTLNTAVYLARLLAGRARVSYVTLLGDDPFSDEMRIAWAAEGLDLDLVGRCSGEPSGLYAITTDPRGERSFTYWRSAAPVRRLFGPTDDAARVRRLARYDVLYFSAITLAVLYPEGRHKLLELAGQFRAGGRQVVFDDNYRPRLWASADDARGAVRCALERATLALISADDEVALFGPAAPVALLDRVLAWGCPEVVLRRGAEPCLLAWPGGRTELPAHQIERVVDTTAAGDAFNAAYLAARLEGAAPPVAAAAGHRLAARVVQVAGALIPLAHWSLDSSH